MCKTRPVFSGGSAVLLKAAAARKDVLSSRRRVAATAEIAQGGGRVQGTTTGLRADTQSTGAVRHCLPGGECEPGPDRVLWSAHHGNNNSPAGVESRLLPFFEDLIRPLLAKQWAVARRQRSRRVWFGGVDGDTLTREWWFQINGDQPANYCRPRVVARRSSPHSRFNSGPNLFEATTSGLTRAGWPGVGEMFRPAGLSPAGMPARQRCSMVPHPFHWTLPGFDAGAGACRFSGMQSKIGRAHV